MDTLPPEEGFLGLTGDDAATAGDKPGVTIVPFGLEASVSYGGGTAAGPQAMIEASHQVELFDEELWRDRSASSIWRHWLLSPSRKTCDQR